MPPGSNRAAISYLLPLRSSVACTAGDLDAYVRWLAPRVELIIVDGSPDHVFAEHAAAWSALATHVAPAPDLQTPMGKVGGVLTGVRLASHERLVIADDDVRYDADSLQRVTRALEDADVVRPQNYFAPLPWHARWDSARSLLNRTCGGDWPGTLAVRRSTIVRTGGYDGTAMFENLELVRTVLAAGGREAVLLDAFVARRPSTTSHFWSQRIRQAYDEFARPHRLAAQLALLPLTLTVGRRFGLPGLALGAVALMGAAEAGRRRGGASRVFPASTTLMAPLWVAERALCSWLALGSRVFLGGVPYRGRRLRHAATSLRDLRRQHASARLTHSNAHSTARRRSA